MLKQALQTLRRSFGELPDSYLCIDTETTGFDRAEDLIWNFGACLVDKDEILAIHDIVLDWTQHPSVDARWLRQRCERTVRHMAQNGRVCHLSESLLREKGLPPEEGMEVFAEHLLQANRLKLPILGHGFLKFDAVRICRQLKEFLGLDWRFTRERVLDTGAIEKSLETGWPPAKGEIFYDYAMRVLNKPSTKKWNLDTHCMQKYDLVSRYQFDKSLLHTAAGDSLACHLLLKTYRQLSAES